MMARRRFQLGLVYRGARVSRECLDDRHLRSVYVAFGAEIASMTSGAGRRYLLPRAVGTRQLSVEVESKIGPLVRRRLGEFRHVLAGEPAGLGQGHMTGRAAGVRSRQMRGLNLVTVEAGLSHCQSNLHPVAANRMT